MENRDIIRGVLGIVLLQGMLVEAIQKEAIHLVVLLIQKVLQLIVVVRKMSAQPIKILQEEAGKQLGILLVEEKPYLNHLLKKEYQQEEEQAYLLIQANSAVVLH